MGKSPSIFEAVRVPFVVILPVATMVPASIRLLTFNVSVSKLFALIFTTSSAPLPIWMRSFPVVLYELTASFHTIRNCPLDANSCTMADWRLTSLRLPNWAIQSPGWGSPVPSESVLENSIQSSPAAVTSFQYWRIVLPVAGFFCTKKNWSSSANSLLPHGNSKSACQILSWACGV